jgi:PAS domain S-box-containing protein
MRRPAKGLAKSPVSGRQESPAPDLASSHGNFFDLIGVMAVMIDRQGTIIQFNRKAEGLTGYPRDEAVGQDWFSLLLPEQERDRARELMTDGLRRDVEHRTLYLPVMARNGSRLPVCWSMSTVCDNEGNVSGVFGLGFVPAGPDAPCVEIGRQMESYCSAVSNMTHDLINHTQVVLGYLEMAAERTGDNKELRCMLDRAAKSMVKCSDISVKVHKLSNSHLK